MAWIVVESYYMRYNIDQKECIVGVNFREDGRVEGRLHAEHLAVTPEVALFLADMLRHEKPVYYDPEARALATGREQVGEGEAGG